MIRLKRLLKVVILLPAEKPRNAGRLFCWCKDNSARVHNMFIICFSLVKYLHRFQRTTTVYPFLYISSCCESFPPVRIFAPPNPGAVDRHHLRAAESVIYIKVQSLLKKGFNHEEHRLENRPEVDCGHHRRHSQHHRCYQLLAELLSLKPPAANNQPRIVNNTMLRANPSFLFQKKMRQTVSFVASFLLPIYSSRN